MSKKKPPISKGEYAAKSQPKVVSKAIGASSNSEQRPFLIKAFPWFLFILAILCYANTIGHGYTFDDHLVITGNEFTKQGLAGIPDLITHDFFEGVYGKEGGMELTGGRFRPLSLVTFAIEWQFLGSNPAVGHGINILLFAITSIVLFQLLNKWFGIESWIPMVASLLYVAHPIHTEVVANIKSRDEILCLLFLLGALHKLWDYANGKKGISSVGLGCLYYFLAMLSKETAFMYAPIMPVAVYVLQKKDIKASLGASAPYIATAVLYFIIRLVLMGKMVGDETNKDIMENPFVNSDFVEKFATIGVILWKYFLLCILPHPLSSDYSFNQIPFTTFSDPVSLLGWGLYLGMLGFAAFSIWKRNVLALFVAMYFLPLFITSNIPFNIGAPMGERFLYLPSLAVCLAAGWAFDKFLPKQAIPFITGIIVAGFVFLTIQRNPAWQSNLALFETDVPTSPNSAKIQYYYGNALLNDYLEAPNNAKDKAKIDKAVAAFTKSIQINPNFHHAHYQLANAYDQKRDGVNMLKSLQAALKIAPNHIKSTLMIGKAYGMYMNDPDQALVYLEKYVNVFKMQDEIGYQYLGTCYAMKGRLNEALATMQKAIQINPNNHEVYQNIATVYDKMGDKAKAAETMAKAEKLRRK